MTSINTINNKCAPLRTWLQPTRLEEVKPRSFGHLSFSSVCNGLAFKINERLCSERLIGNHKAVENIS